MSPNILVTGAAGYIGGSVLHQLFKSQGVAKDAKLFAAVRSKDQIDLLSRLKVTPVLLDVNNEKAVLDVVIQNNIDMIINAIASFIPDIVRNMIGALGERRKASGQDVFFIHSGVITVFAAEAGWPYGAIKDSEDVYQKEKAWDFEHLVRVTDVLVVEQAKGNGVTAVNVVVPGVYGVGTGEGRKLSVSLPAYIRTSIAEGVVHVFDKDSTPPWTHISDLAALYVLIVEKMLQKEEIPSGEKGYYFGIAHRAQMSEIMKRITMGLHRRGLVSEAEPRVWPSDAVAAEKMGFPVQHVRAMGTASGEQIVVNPLKIGWKPKWTEQMFLDNMDGEVQSSIDLDTVKASIFDPYLNK